MASDLENKIGRIQTNVTNALSKIAEKGVTVPSGANSDNLAELIAPLSLVTYETWVFEMEDGTTVEKEVAAE